MELTGTPAALLFFAIFFLCIYLFMYLPAKLVITLIAHTKRRTDKLQLLHGAVVVTEYDPPAGFKPAELGFLYDSRTGVEEAAATVLDLEQRGILHLEPTNDGPQLIGVKVIAEPVVTIDTAVIGKLVDLKGKILDEKTLNLLSVSLGHIVGDTLRQKGYLQSVSEQVRGSLIRIGTIIAVLTLICPVLLLHPTTLSGIMGMLIAIVFFFLPAYFVAALFLYAVYWKIVGEPWLGTPKLKQVWPEIEGYRQFLEQVELDNLQFESQEAKVGVRNKTLPYAVALGLHTGWRKRFRM